MNDPVWLIKIDRCFHVVRNYAIMLPRLGDAIYLNRQENRNLHTIQLTSQEHHRRGSPAVSEQNDPSLRFFLAAESSVVVAIEQAKNGLIGGPTVSVLENVNVRIRGEVPARFLRKPDWTLVRIVAAGKASDKTDNDIARSRNCSNTAGGANRE